MKLAVSLALFVTFSAFSATLTQERRVVPIGPLTRAASYQYAADVASNGDGFVAIWLDDRAADDPIHHAGTFLWASHFEVDGTLTSLAD